MFVHFGEFHLPAIHCNVIITLIEFALHSGNNSDVELKKQRLNYLVIRDCKYELS